CNLNFRFHCLFFFSSRRRHTRSKRDWSSDVCSSDLSRDLSIDGYMADDISSMSAEVMPGKKAKDSLTIDELFLDEGEELPKLEDTLEMSLLVADYETFEDINSYDVHIDFK